MTQGDHGNQVGNDRPKQTESGVPTLDASGWFGENREVVIVHRGAHYRLRLTQSGKLILTK